MATHVTCHTSDIYPSRFPPPQPTARNHGYVSDYEHHNVMYNSKGSTYPVSVTGGFENITRDELPMYGSAPLPTQCDLGDLASLVDPDLCITPEKTVKSISRLDVNKQDRTASIDHKSSHSRASQRVRFDSTVDVRQLSPQSSIINSSINSEISVEDVIGPSIDLETESLDGSTLVSTYKYSVHCPQTHSSLKSNSSSQPARHLASSGQLNRKVASKRQTSEQSIRAAVNKEYGTMMDPEHVLTRAEFNSTLRVKKEMMQLRDAELDLVPALERKLKLSEKTRNTIKEKAVSRVNLQRDAFAADLCQVQPRKDEVAVSVEQALSSKVRPVRSKQPRPEDYVQSPPDIMEFFTPALQKETPSLTLRGVPTTQPKLRTASPHRAFDVYSHIRSWEHW